MRDLHFSLRRHFIETQQVKQVFQRIGDVHHDMLRSGTSKGLTLLGVSGSGKTTALRQCLASSFPDSLIPGKLRRTLEIATPSTPTKKNLASAVLTGLNDPFADSRSHTEGVKTKRIIKLLTNLQTEIVVFDEAQHIVDCTRSTTYEAADWVKEIMNACNIVVVLAGLERTQQLLWTNEQLRRRFSAVVRLRGYDLYVREEAEQFVALLAALRSFLPVPSVDFLTKEMIQRFHFASNGLIDYLIKVLDHATWQVLVGRSNGIDSNLLSQAFRDEVWAEAPLERIPFATEFNFKPLSGAREPFEVFNGIQS